MSKTVTTAAAAQPLVSFSINLPADIAEQLVALAAAESESSGEPHTPEQLAAIGIASLVECQSKPGEFYQVDDGAQARAFEANAPEADAELVNLTLLRADFDQIVEDAEEALRGNLIGADDRSGAELAAYAESMTVDRVLEIQAEAAALRDADGFPTATRAEIEEELETPRLQAAYLRRLLEAKGGVR